MLPFFIFLSNFVVVAKRSFAQIHVPATVEFLDKQTRILRQSFKELSCILEIQNSQRVGHGAPGVVVWPWFPKLGTSAKNFL